MAKAAVKIKFSGIIKSFGASSSGEQIVISQAKTSNPKKMLELAEVKNKENERVEGTIELIQKTFPEAE